MVRRAFSRCHETRKRWLKEVIEAMTPIGDPYGVTENYPVCWWRLGHIWATGRLLRMRMQSMRASEHEEQVDPLARLMCGKPTELEFGLTKRAISADTHGSIAEISLSVVAFGRFMANAAVRMKKKKEKKQRPKLSCSAALLAASLHQDTRLFQARIKHAQCRQADPFCYMPLDVAALRDSWIGRKPVHALRSKSARSSVSTRIVRGFSAQRASSMARRRRQILIVQARIRAKKVRTFFGTTCSSNNRGANKSIIEIGFYVLC